MMTRIRDGAFRASNYPKGLHRALGDLKGLLRAARSLDLTLSLDLISVPLMVIYGLCEDCIHKSPMQ